MYITNFCRTLYIIYIALMIGVFTIGNATLIAYDNEPIISIDP
jgi:hypothetical protein